MCDGTLGLIEPIAITALRLRYAGSDVENIVHYTINLRGTGSDVVQPSKGRDEGKE